MLPHPPCKKLADCSNMPSALCFELPIKKLSAHHCHRLLIFYLFIFFPLLLLFCSPVVVESVMMVALFQTPVCTLKMKARNQHHCILMACRSHEAQTREHTHAFIHQSDKPILLSHCPSTKTELRELSQHTANLPIDALIWHLYDPCNSVTLPSFSWFHV